MISARINADLFEKIEDFRREGGYTTRSEALVQLLVLGLAAYATSISDEGGVC